MKRITIAFLLVFTGLVALSQEKGYVSIKTKNTPLNASITPDMIIYLRDSLTVYGTTNRIEKGWKLDTAFTLGYLFKIKADGGIPEEVDPVFASSLAAGITSQDTIDWNDAYTHSLVAGNPHSTTYDEVGAEQAIAKDTGYLKWNGLTWVWDDTLRWKVSDTATYLLSRTRAAATYALISHSQAISTITGLTDSLNNRYRRSDTTNILLTKAMASATYQPKDAELLTIAGLSNSTGYLKNNGSGTFSYTTPSSSDVGAVAIGDSSGFTSSYVTGYDNSLLASAIITIPIAGTDPPGDRLSAVDWIKAVFYNTTNPQATLTGGDGNQELHSAGTYTDVVTYGGNKTSTSANISTIVLTASPSQSITPEITVSNPAGSNSGTRTVTVTYNTALTITNTVTSTDEKTATASTSYGWQPKRYWGRTADPVPSSATIVAAAGGGSQLTTSKAKTDISVGASGSNYVYYAYPSSYGTLTTLTVGGFDSKDAFTENIISVTNASGYTQDYRVWVSNNKFSDTTPTIVAQ